MDLRPDDLRSPEALESVLAGALRGRRLAFEVGLDRNLRDSLVAAFTGTTLPACLNMYAAVARRFPATLVVTLAADAVFAYRAGDFWGQTALRGASGTEIGRAFTQAINKLGLEPFGVFDEQGAARYLSRILAHGGVPAYCLGDLFRLVLHAREQGLIEAQDVVEILHDNGSLAQQVDRPVRRFLRDTGSIGRDFLQRVLELPEEADTTVATPVVASSIGLPDYVVTEFRRLFPTLKCRRGPLQRLARARLVFDADVAEGPELILPVAASVLEWRVIPETGAANVIPVFRPVRGEEIRVPVGPSTRWHVSTLDLMTGTRRESSILGVSEGRPVLVFDVESMHHVPDARFAPARLLCIIAPCSLAVASGDVEIIRSAPLHGEAWTGWLAVEVAIDGTGVLHGNHESQLIEVRVGREDRPDVSFGNLVDGALTLDGGTVFSGPPQLQDLPWASAEADRWQVTVSGRDIETTSFVPSSEVAEVNAQIANVLGGRLLADVTLRFLGPIGGGYRVAGAIVPGLSVTLPSAPLFPQDVGEVVVQVADGLQLGVADGSIARFDVTGEAPRAFVGVTDGGSALVEVALDCPVVRWRLVAGDSSMAPFTSQVIHWAFHPQEQQRVFLFVDVGQAGEAGTLFVSGFGSDVRCYPLGSARSCVLRFDLSDVVTDAIRSETAPLHVELEALGRRLVVAQLDESVAVSLLQADYVVGEDSVTLRYTIEQSRAMAGRALQVRCLDRPWARPFIMPLGGGESEGAVECSRLRPGRYAVRAVLDNGNGTLRVPEGSAQVYFTVPWGSPGAEAAPVEDERELLLRAVMMPDGTSPTLRHPEDAAPAAVLLLGAHECNATSAQLLLDAVPVSMAEWISSLDHAGEEYGMTSSVMVRASVRLLGRMERNAPMADPSVGRLASRTLRLAATAANRQIEPHVIEELTGLAIDTGLNEVGILGSQARPAPLASLQKVLRALRRLPAPPLSANGRARGIIEVRCWALSPDARERKWLKELVNNYPLFPHLSLLDPVTAKACHQLRDWIRDGGGADGQVVAALHVASFEAAAHLASGTQVRSEAAEFLASVAKTFPEYVESRLAYFLRKVAIKQLADYRH